MQRITLESKTIRSVGYDVDTETLHVWLRKGRHVVHHNIPEGVYRNLVVAEPPDFYYGFYIAEDVPKQHSRMAVAVKYVSICVLGLLFLGVMASEVSNRGTEMEITSAIK